MNSTGQTCTALNNFDDFIEYSKNDELAKKYFTPITNNDRTEIIKLLKSLVKLDSKVTRISGSLSCGITSILSNLSNSLINPFMTGNTYLHKNKTDDTMFIVRKTDRNTTVFALKDNSARLYRSDGENHYDNLIEFIPKKWDWVSIAYYGVCGLCSSYMIYNSLKNPDTLGDITIVTVIYYFILITITSYGIKLLLK